MEKFIMLRINFIYKKHTHTEGKICNQNSPASCSGGLEIRWGGGKNMVGLRRSGEWGKPVGVPLLAYPLKPAGIWGRRSDSPRH